MTTPPTWGGKAALPPNAVPGSLHALTDLLACVDKFILLIAAPHQALTFGLERTKLPYLPDKHVCVIDDFRDICCILS